MGGRRPGGIGRARHREQTGLLDVTVDVPLPEQGRTGFADRIGLFQVGARERARLDQRGEQGLEGPAAQS